MAHLIPSGSVAPRRRLLRGFTFIELTVVISIIVILITIAIPIYNKTILRSKETVLHQNLTTLRTVIDNYTFDKQKAPQSLQEMVTAGYLREVPYDPMTGSNTTWRTIQEDALTSVNQSEPGLYDVKSGSDKISLDGTPYADW
jgi:general secretion pathway protein G